MTNYEFIKEFQKIKLTNICKKLKVNQSNVTSNQTSEENYRRIKEAIEKELLNLFIKDNKNSEKILTMYLYNELLEKIEKENRLLREML